MGLINGLQIDKRWRIDTCGRQRPRCGSHVWHARLLIRPESYKWIIRTKVVRRTKYAVLQALLIVV
jgi:hypothetical protein